MVANPRVSPTIYTHVVFSSAGFREGKVRRTTQVLLSILLTGCGGGGKAPVSPTAAQPAPTPTPVPFVTVISGQTGQSVVGAQVIVAGTAFVTDTTGQARLTTAPNGATVDIIAPGFFDRQTTIREGSANLSRYTLWPRQPLPLFDEGYTRILVYTSSSTGDAGASTPLERLAPSTTQIRIVLSPQLQADSTALALHQFGADSMNTAVSGLFRYSVGPEVPGSLNVDTSVGGELCGPRSGAYALLRVNGRSEITGLSIVYCDIRFARDGSFVLHEMGHTLGLGHSDLLSDVMSPIGTTEIFSDRELLLMKLMYQRPAGNTFPDNDRNTAGLSSPRVRTIVCRR